MSKAAAAISLALAVAVPFAAPGVASARILNLNRIGGAIQLGTEISHQEISGADASTRIFDRYRFDQVLQLNSGGSILTSEFIGFRLGGTFGLRQNLSGAEAEPMDPLSMILGYDGFVNILPTKPVSLLFFARRFQDEVMVNVGNDTDTLTEALGATLRFNNRWFPATISAEELHSLSETRSDFNFSRRDETMRSLEFNGTHASEATNARLNARAEEIKDDSTPAVGDYRVYEADATFSHRWGLYWEKHFRMSGGYLERQGNFSVRSANQSASFSWDPTETLATSLEQNFDRFESFDQLSTTNSVRLSLRHDLWESLRTDLNASYDRTDQTAGVRSAYGANLTTRYEKKLPWDSLLLLDFAARYRFEDRRFDENQTIRTGETLALVSPIDNFLSKTRIDRASITVFESREGTEIPEAGNYSVFEVGDRVSIVAILGGVIDREGLEQVWVTYGYLADPSAKVSRFGFRTAVGWDLGWIALRYQHAQDGETLVAGADQPLADTVQDSIRLDLMGEWGALRASADAQFLKDVSISTQYNEITLGQKLVWQPNRFLHLSSSVRASRREFRNPSRRTRTIAATVAAQWRFWTSSTLRVFGDFRDLHNSDSLNQRDLRLGARARLRSGKIEMTPTFTWTRRQRGDSMSNDIRGVLRLVRRF